eukprot:2959742-Pyramimonas_sp.AAC.1
MVSEAPAVRGELSSRSLSGKGQGGKGKIDEFLLRYQMKNYMVNTWMETRPFKAQDKTIMREAVASWASYRSYFGNGRTGAADL